MLAHDILFWAETLIVLPASIFFIWYGYKKADIPLWYAIAARLLGFFSLLWVLTCLAEDAFGQSALHGRLNEIYQVSAGAIIGLTAFVLFSSKEVRKYKAQNKSPNASPKQA